MSKKKIFVIAGNVKGEEIDPLIASNIDNADTAIIFALTETLKSRKQIKDDGEFSTDIIAEATVVEQGKMTFVRDVWHTDNFDAIRKNCHIRGIHLRHRRSCKIFAEWIVREAEI